MRSARSISFSRFSISCRERGWLRWGASRQQLVVNTVPLPSLSIDPPSSTKSLWSSYRPSTMPFSYRLRLMELSRDASNFSPHPLKRKSSSVRGPSSAFLSFSEMKAWSLAHVSLVGHWCSVTLFICSSESLPHSILSTSFVSGATIISGSYLVMASAISTYVLFISSRQ